VFFSAEAGPPAVELASARAHFFAPRRTRDLFGGTSTIDYDADDFLVCASVDAVGNTSSAENDYRTLQPALVIDANGNRTRVAFDTLGLVAAIAVLGKPDAATGDEIDESLAMDLSAERLAAFVAA